MMNTWSEEDPESTSSSRPASRTSCSSSCSSSSPTTAGSSSSQRPMQIFRNISSSAAVASAVDSPYSAPTWNPNDTNSTAYYLQHHQQSGLDGGDNNGPLSHANQQSEVGLKWASTGGEPNAIENQDLFNYRHQNFGSSIPCPGKGGGYVHGMDVKAQGQQNQQFHQGTENTGDDSQQGYRAGEFDESECKTENNEDVLDHGSAMSAQQQPAKEKQMYQKSCPIKNKELKRLLTAPVQYSPNNAVRSVSAGLLNTASSQQASSAAKALNYTAGRYDNGNWNDQAQRAAEVDDARSPSAYTWFPPVQAQLLSHDPLMLNETQSSSRSPLTPPPEPQHHQQQQHYHHQAAGGNRRSSNEEDEANLVKFNSWVGGQNNDLPIYPSGLEIVLREVPPECKNMITPQDVPESARVRGYFTVAELTHLKRVLKSRLEERRICGGGAGSVMMMYSGGNKENPPGGIFPDNPNTTVVSAFKDAMHALNPDDVQQHQGFPPAASPPGPVGSPRVLNEQASSAGASAGGTGGGTDAVHHGVPLDTSSPQNNHGFMAPVHYTRAHDRSLKDKPDIYKGLSTGPPPPYRTSTLVLKLLEIGHYHFRSFSETNPNRLRVLFNTQRLAYDCQLPTLPPSPETAQPLRKILTIEVGFDQIKAMKFGTDRMHIRVDGPPFLNVSFTPSNEDAGQENLTAEEKYLLEQIDRGQMKLSQHHNLHFLNERLVSVLENQFKEHPRLRHLLGSAPKTTSNYR